MKKLKKTSKMAKAFFVRGKMTKLVFVLGLLAMAANADMMDINGSGSTTGSGSVPNETLTCAKRRNIQGPVEFPFFPPLLPLLVRCVLILYYMFVTFLGVALNLWTPYLVWKFKSLRTMSFSFAVQISILNIIRSLSVVVHLASVIPNRWLLGEVMCIAVGGLLFTFLVLRVLLMVVFVTDRFCLVFSPYCYPRYRIKVMCTLLPIVYLVALLSSIPLVVMDCFSFSSAAWTCQWTFDCNAECNILRRVIGAGVLIPLNIMPMVLYAALYCRAKRTGNTGVPATNEIAIDGQDVKKEWRATITFFLIFLDVFLLSAVPGIMSLIAGGISSATDSFDSIWFYIVDTIFTNLFLLVRVVDPIFILRNKDIKEALAQLTWLPPFWYTGTCKSATN